MRGLALGCLASGTLLQFAVHLPKRDASGYGSKPNVGTDFDHETTWVWKSLSVGVASERFF